ncbi:MAG: alanine--tRNA ligase [Candidatus Omnitrophica bacterium]|nr:alanine--tRNA ligase [Candidatus Omnitrophota bacterium]
MQADLLRKKFLDFFKARKHKIIESDTLVPKDDPTVLFTPAGMNQFKKEFLGFDSGFTRAATAQRCLRTDDLDKVGKTTGHHTFFEMLGNFSFGDYFKKEAVSWAWEFLTEELKIDKEKLWVSVYQDDEEAYNVWKDIIPEKRIVKLGDKENFWPSEAKLKGPNGPCGPCSEIFFDLGKEAGCGEAACDPSCDCGRFIEVWNLVFTQFNRKEDGTLLPLPKKNIDTGMGLERLAAVMQAAPNNFETDLFKPIIETITSYELRAKNYKLIYAIADHIRAVVFSIYDGVLPSNESRGYIVRKIIRKSVLHLRDLGIKKPFLNKLVPVVAETMKAPYPELLERQEDIAQIVLAEEKNFINALDSSGALFRSKFAGVKDAEAAGSIAFQLYDTYGIPPDLTKDWLAQHDVPFSQPAFNKEMEAQKTRSKEQSSMKGDVFSLKELDYGTKETRFTGYKEYETKAKVVKIVKEGTEAKKINKAETATVILDKSCFYAEQGGQVGDAGQIVKGKNIFAVTDTKKAGGVTLHTGTVKEGTFKKSDLVTAKVDKERRLNIARNHTATHLLQAALRKVLGAHVQQQGSLVADDRLRFDFTHFKALDDEQKLRIEELVNSWIMENHPVEKKEKTLAEARKSGALAFFGEKYENRVRVVSIEGVSKELCGGTHLDFTGSIGPFKILQESSIASGIRRIEAVTGSFAYKKIKEEEESLKDAESLLNTTQDKLIPELEKRLGRIKELEKQLSSRKMESAQSSVDDLIRSAEVVNGIRLIVKVEPGLDMGTVRGLVDLIKQKTDSAVIICGVSAGSNVSLALGVTPDLCLKGADAAKLIKEIAAEIGGSGGGRKDFAQAGGNRPENLEQVLKRLKELISQIKF